MGIFFRTGCVLLLVLLAASAEAQRGRFMTLEEFRELAFAGRQPAAKKLWLQGEHKAAAARVLGHDYPALRVRYWIDGSRTAWVLEEIGKELPITLGVVVEDGRIVELAVLEFRESRGGEIRYPFFTDQFRGLRLAADDREPKLDGHVDGITGATLSVRATRKVATLALFFHRQVIERGAHGELDAMAE